jgi:hypothetical protein
LFRVYSLLIRKHIGSIDSAYGLGKSEALTRLSG